MISLSKSVFISFLEFPGRLLKSLIGTPLISTTGTLNSCLRAAFSLEFDSGFEASGMFRDHEGSPATSLKYLSVANPSPIRGGLWILRCGIDSEGRGWLHAGEIGNRWQTGHRDITLHLGRARRTPELYRDDNGALLSRSGSWPKSKNQN